MPPRLLILRAKPAPVVATAATTTPMMIQSVVLNPLDDELPPPPPLEVGVKATEIVCDDPDTLTDPEVTLEL